MNKIPTLFMRGKDHKVINKLRQGCEWVLSQGYATELLKGVNVRLTVRSSYIVRVEKRHKPDKHEKIKGIVNPWYVEVRPLDFFIKKLTRLL